MPQLSPSFWFILICFTLITLFCLVCSLMSSKALSISSSKQILLKKKFTLL